MNLQSIRLTGVNANYYRAKLEAFEQLMIARNLAEYVEFGKQDPRGNPSISLFKNHCIKQQRHYTNKQAMIEFVAGYMQAVE